MNRPTTAREALIAEAIGDVAHLLDRVEALTQGMEGARQALTAAALELGRQLGAVDARMEAITESAKTRTVEHIVRRTNEVAARSLEAQSRAMHEAARLVFAEQVDPTLGRLAASLRQLIQRVDRPWDLWLTHAATAATSAALTWFVVASVAFK